MRRCKISTEERGWFNIQILKARPIEEERTVLVSDNSVNRFLIKQARLEVQELEQGKARQSLELCLPPLGEAC